MSSIRTWSRQIVFAVTLLLPQLALAQLTITYDAEVNQIAIDGINESENRLILQEPERIRLQLQGTRSNNGMPITLVYDEHKLFIKPRFSLIEGYQYRVQLSLPEREVITDFIDIPKKQHPVPRLVRFSPSQSIIPANTLRMYLSFSEPMARGQLKQHISLIRSDGSVVDSPFLNLETELWDSSQKRLTLLFDPGRIKQGVGPNQEKGEPLVPGERLQLVINKQFKSAHGMPLATDATVSFVVGAPVYRHIDTKNWVLNAPTVLTHEPLSLSFDRIIDQGHIYQFFKVLNAAGKVVSGSVSSDGGGWSFTPHHVWQDDEHQLSIDSRLEDVSGNTLYHAFDAKSGSVTHSSITGRINIPLLMTRQQP